MVARFPERLEARYYRATALFLRGKPGDAVAAARQVVEARPDHARAQSLLGAACAAVGQRDCALAAFSAAIKLIVCRDGTISRADDPGLENKKLIAFYFSAHWCAPCRKFTPQLVNYYNQVAPQHPEFEIIFVSCDRSRFNWETYMREARMPWPAIDYDQLNGLAGLKQLSGGSIPSLLLIDATGRLLSSSYEGENYLGPQKVIADLQKIFSTPPRSVAETR